MARIAFHLHALGVASVLTTATGQQLEATPDTDGPSNTQALSFGAAAGETAHKRTWDEGIGAHAPFVDRRWLGELTGPWMEVPDSGRDDAVFGNNVVSDRDNVNPGVEAETRSLTLNFDPSGGFTGSVQYREPKSEKYIYEGTVSATNPPCSNGYRQVAKSWGSSERVCRLCLDTSKVPNARSGNCIPRNINYSGLDNWNRKKRWWRERNTHIIERGSPYHLPAWKRNECAPGFYWSWTSMCYREGHRGCAWCPDGWSNQRRNGSGSWGCNVCENNATTSWKEQQFVTSCEAAGVGERGRFENGCYTCEDLSGFSEKNSHVTQIRHIGMERRTVNGVSQVHCKYQ